MARDGSRILESETHVGPDVGSLLILLVLPVLIDVFSRRRQPTEAEPRPALAE